MHSLWNKENIWLKTEIEENDDEKMSPNKLSDFLWAARKSVSYCVYMYSKVFGMHQQVVVGRIRGVGVKLVSLGTQKSWTTSDITCCRIPPFPSLIRYFLCHEVFWLLILRVTLFPFDKKEQTNSMDFTVEESSLLSNHRQLSLGLLNKKMFKLFLWLKFFHKHMQKFPRGRRSFNSRHIDLCFPKWEAC